MKGPRPHLFAMPTGHSGMGWHQIEPFVKCPKEYQLRRVRQIRPFGTHLSLPLSVGALVHAGRAQLLYDKYKGDIWREQLVTYAQTMANEEILPLLPAALPTAVEIMECYADYWEKRAKPEPLAVEFQLDPRPLIPDAPQWAWRTARLDSIERWRGKTWIGELKTTSSHAGRVRDTYSLHGQILLQISLWGEKETKLFGPLAGVLLDPVVKRSGKRPPAPKERVPLDIANLSHALKWFRKDFTHWVMQASSIQWNDSVERRPVCMRPEGGCDFRDLCAKGRRSAGKYVFGATNQRISEWTPSEGKEVPPWE